MSQADTARDLAESLLLPAALEIDRADTVPRHYLDKLAAAGLYDPPADPIEAVRVVEALAGASLATTFVWIQHQGPARALTAAGHPLAAALRAGEARAGIAYAALRRPGPPSATASPLPGGAWRLDGFAPWVTGWGLIDYVLAAGRYEDRMVWVLLDAAESPTQAASRVRLATMDSSSTYELRWCGHHVPAGQVIAVEPYADWRARDAANRATNGYLAIGVAARCALVLGDPALATDVESARAALDRSGPETVAGARAAASLLALRAAAAVVAGGGGRSVEAASDAARLMREATFLLVFGQSPDIRALQLQSLVRVR